MVVVAIKYIYVYIIYYDSIYKSRVTSGHSVATSQMQERWGFDHRLVGNPYRDQSLIFLVANESNKDTFIYQMLKQHNH